MTISVLLKNHIASIFIACLIAIPGFSQNHSLEGFIHDSNGPIQFASVGIAGTQFGTITDEKGYFKLNTLKEGIYKLNVSHVGFRTENLNISVPAQSAKPKIVVLNPSLHQLNEMVVTGTRTEKDASLSTIKVSTINSKMLENTNSINLAEGLNFQTGLRVEVDCQTCNYTQLRMNGLGGAYSQILINSRPIFSSLVGLYGLEQISSTMIDKVEIVKGGGSSLYGSNAIGGTVNIITKTPQKDSYSFGSQAGLIGGSASDMLLYGDYNKVFKKGGLSLFANGRTRESFDSNGDGFTEIPEIKNISIGLKTFYQPSDNQKLNFDFFKINEYRRGGNKLDRAPHETDQAEERYHDIYIGGMDYTVTLPEIKSNVNVYAAGQYTHRDHYTGIDGIDAYGTTANYSFNSGAQWNYYLSNNIFTAGIDYQLDDIKDEIPFYNYSIDQTTFQTGMFAQADLTILNNLMIVTGLRLDFHNMLESPVLNPRLSLMYEPAPGLKVRGSFATGFRAPQAFDTDLHIAFSAGGISMIKLDPNLKEETSRSYTLSLSYDEPHQDYIYGFSIDGFYTMLNDPFILEEAGRDEDNNMIVSKQNGNKASVYGASLEGRLNYKYLIEMQLGITLQRSYHEAPIAWSANIPGEKGFLRTPEEYGFYTFQYNPYPKTHFNFTGTLTGTMLVPHFGGAVGVDGDRIENSPVFWDGNIKLTQDVIVSSGRFKIELFTGIQNIWNAYQDDFDKGKNRDSNYIYGPAKPRTFFAGIKFSSI